MIRKLLLVAMCIVLVSVAWWWADSSATCKEQDEYTLHGACLMRVRAQAEANDRRAQWLYGQYLIAEDKPAEGYEWLRKSVATATRAIELATLPGLCDRVPGFDAKSIESRLLEVAKQSPDTHLLLVQLYMNSDCAAFDLGKLERQIPLLSQCAALSLNNFLKAADRANVAVSRETARAISVNLARCRQDLETPQGGPVHTAYSEIVRPNLDDIATVERRIAPLLAPPAQ